MISTTPTNSKLASNDVVAQADRLVDHLRQMGSVAVAFSGGVDSTVVAKAAYLALSANAVAITGSSASLAARDLELAKSVANRIGIRHVVVDTAEFADPSYVANDGRRCYFCKSELYDRLMSLRERIGFDVVCSGANVDDLGDYRPGLVAAAERGVRHPLQELGYVKSRVRQLADFWHLPNHDRPASPCLSSRIAVGLEATPERTARIEAAEAFLYSLGFQVLRVRFHENDHARIEVAEAEIPRLVELEMRRAVSQRFKELGFKFVSLDLEGFRSGSLNVLVPVELLR